MLHWRKSTASGDASCVEVARDGDWLLIRDSKDPSGPALRYNELEWKAFVAGVHNGEFDWSEA